jgi:hypothetical protein
MARRRSSDPEPTLFPFLSVLAAVMGTLILIISGMSQIALAQPKPRIDIERFHPQKKSPIYVECRHFGLRIYPDEPSSGAPTFVWNKDIESPASDWMKLASRLELDSTSYVMFLVRADGVASFERARGTISGTRVELGYEPLFGDREVVFHGKAREP